MKKTYLILLFISTALLATKIELNFAPSDPKRVIPSSNEEILSFSGGIKNSVNSIVNISITQKSQRSRKLEELMNDPYFKYFFKQKGAIPKQRAQRALGSGVILSQDGYIVTNNHVIDNAKEITVTLPNRKKEYTATIVGQDKDSDLAVIKIDAKDLPAIALGDSSNLQLGDLVFAVGNPFGVGETVTQGIISALNKNKVGINQYENFIQTDASINPGNSGGALIDSRGALIGINSAILSRSGGNNGIGFAIPTNMVQRVVESLIDTGKVTRGYLGVSISDMNTQLKPLYIHESGAVIVDIELDSVADKFGLKRGDLIYEINNKEINGAIDLKNVIASYKPEEKVSFSVERNKESQIIKVKLGSRDGGGVSNADTILGGLKLSSLDISKKEKYRIPSNTIGVLIEDVAPQSKAEKVGFQSGDVIIQIENITTENMKDLKKAVLRYKNSNKRVYVNRYGMILMFAVEPSVK